jgi:hypothetical protein
MKKTSSPFFRAGRGERGVTRKQFHILLSEKEMKKLVALSKRMKLTGADVLRKLIAEA